MILGLFSFFVLEKSVIFNFVLNSEYSRTHITKIEIAPIYQTGLSLFLF